MVEAGVVSCRHCAQPNWVPAAWSVAELGCTHCGNGLASTGSGGPHAKSFKIFALLGVALAVGLFGTYQWWRRSAPQAFAPNTSYRAPPYTPAPQPPRSPAPESPKPVVVPSPAPASSLPVPIVEGLVRAAKGKNRVVPFQVQAAAGSNYYVKIVAADTEDEIAVLFVYGGNTVKSTMPLGSYRLRYATGATWYGELLMFGWQTKYWSADRKLTFRKQGNSPHPVSINLNRQRGGSLRTQSIDQTRF